jgi:hypothetical protein
MANSDKNILIQPKTNTSGNPKIVLTGANNTPVTMSVQSDGSLNFSGSQGQLFSISNSFSGTLFGASDISGIPGIDFDDTGLIRLAPYNGKVIVGASAVNTATAGATATDVLQVTGNTFTNGTLILAGIPTHANNSAASSLPDGAVYKTSSGELRIKV